MARNPSRGRRCSFESLETRRLLAGDVTARIDDGKLIIKGDSLDNGITITAGATAGEVIVTGVNAGGSATNVNDISNGTITLSGFTGGLKIDMHGGNDSVTITDLDVSGKAKLEGGRGDDEFSLDGVTFGRSLRISMGKDDDTLSLTNVEVADKATLMGRRGNDEVSIDGSTFTKLSVKLSKGDDTLEVTDTEATVKTHFKGGHGTNTYTGSGNTLAGLKTSHLTDESNTGPSPTLAISGTSSINEGAVYTLNLSSTGTGGDTVTKWTINWGDNSEAQVVTGDPSSVTHTYADGPNTWTISATATNPNGTFSANSVVVTVNNVSPTLSISGASTIAEGATYTLNLSRSDIGTDTISKWTITWGDGTAAQVVTGNPSTATHVFADGANNYTISAYGDRRGRHLHSC